MTELEKAYRIAELSEEYDYWEFAGWYGTFENAVKETLEFGIEQTIRDFKAMVLNDYEEIDDAQYYLDELDKLTK